MEGSEEKLGEEARREVLLWHDKVHESQDLSRLHFWRLSFSPSYERELIFERLQQFYVDVGITSYTTYETLGDYDLLLRMWVPRKLEPEEIELKLWRALNELKLWNINYLSCRTEVHWANGDVDPNAWPDLHDPVISEVSQFNRQQAEGNMIARSGRIQELIDTGVLRVVPTQTRGVRFFIIFDHPRVPFNPKNRKIALNTIVKTAQDVLHKWESLDLPSGGPQLSIYDGAGTMTEFLLMVRAPHTHFHDFVRDMVLGLRGAGLDALFDIRPYTHVIADQMFSDFAEERSNLASRSTPIDVEDEESESLEFKATFALNLRAFLATGKQEKDPKISHAVIRAVCGLLNSPTGGVLVMGILETRRELERTKNKADLLASLREQFGYDLGDSPPEDAPNAVIGIEVEVGEGKNFKDPDEYVRGISNAIRDAINPVPWPYLTLDLEQLGDKQVCVIRAQPADVWFYARTLDGNHEAFYVREVGSTRAYSGAESDLYKKVNPRD